MKKTLILALAACLLLFTGCTSSTDKNDQQGAARIEPFVTQINLEEPEDGEYPAEFQTTALQKNEDGYVLEAELLAEEFFDAVAITQLKEGDVIVSEGQEYTVESVENNDTGYVVVNGGLEQGGIEFVANEGGTWVVEKMDDAHSYQSLGKVNLKLSPDFVFTDDSDLDHPNVTYDAAGLQALGDDGQGFNRNNTTVTITDGMVTAAHRIFLP